MVKERYLKIVADSPWRAVCKYCRQPVIWARLASEPRWMLFDGDVKTLKEREGALYFPLSLVHWRNCFGRGARQQHRHEARG